MGSAAPNDASAEPIQAASVPLQSSNDASGGIGPEFVAVILAATAGTRLFPLTSEGDDEHGGMSDDDDEFDALPQEPDSEEEGEDGGNDVEMKGGDDAAAGASRGDDDDPTVPKHLLPVAGTSILRSLLGSVASAGFSRCIVAVGASDNGLNAKSILSEEAAATAAGSSSGVGGSSISRVSDHMLRMAVGGGSASGGGKKSKASAGSAGKSMDISIVTLGVNCGGSADISPALGPSRPIAIWSSSRAISFWPPPSAMAAPSAFWQTPIGEDSKRGRALPPPSLLRPARCSYRTSVTRTRMASRSRNRLR